MKTLITGSDDNTPNEYCEDNDDDSVKDPNYEANDETSCASSWSTATRDKNCKCKIKLKVQIDPSNESCLSEGR